MDKSPFWFSSLPRLGAARQGWKKPGLKKKPPSGFFFGGGGGLGIFWVFWFFGVFSFFYIFAQKREFLGFFQFQEYL
jgi:hypothetical protein